MNAQARTQLLPVKIGPDEQLIRARELAEAMNELETNELQRKTAMAGFKEAAETLKAQASRLQDIVRNQREFRQVEVYDRPNYERMTMDTIRADTGECIGSRGLEPAERNLELFPRAVESEQA